MKNFFFPIHLDGGNRGCEAIAKGTAEILDVSKENMYAYCKNVELDSYLGVNDYYKLIPKVTLNLKNKIIRIIISIFNQKLASKYSKSVFFDSFLSVSLKGDYMLSTGGDLMCYQNPEDVFYTNEWAIKNGLKSVLWGCSICQEKLTTEKIEALKKFSIISVRESLSFDILKKIGIKNLYLFPDPAFVLKPVECDLPESFCDSSFIGINFSNFVGEIVDDDTIIGKNINNMINHILSNTKYRILLIPHVCWDGQDDRVICNNLFKRFRNSGRVLMLEMEKYNYCQIRYIISKCIMFIGSRTHSMISAYSECVPSLALGYSIKSKGIAKDLGLPAETVVDCMNLNDNYVLSRSFDYLNKNRYEIFKILQRNIPDYKVKAYSSKSIFNDV